MTFRTESDLLGDLPVPADALHGAHTQRALENFSLAGRPPHPALIHAFGAVKLACLRTNQDLRPWPPEVFEAMEIACEEMRRGDLDASVVVDALQGGAGTSTNMNVNEVLANRALQRLGQPPGTYALIHPIEDVNRHQSTNDTYPTALKVAALTGLRELERQVVGLVEAFQGKEREFADLVKVARTEYQDAALTTLGRAMGAFAEPLARDRWRISRCEERLRVVNLGGTAIGSGLGAPRAYIFRVVDRLRDITGFGLARAENLADATQNADVFVEVSGILRALACSLMKICGDLRLLSSGPSAGFGEIRLPPRQAGSSLMPGKVNPVIPEAVTQAALAAMAHDFALTQACSMGSLELNPFMPLIADNLLSEIDLLARACDTLNRLCVTGMEAAPDRLRMHRENGTAAATALVETLGYDAASLAAKRALETGLSLRQVVVEGGLLTEAEFEARVRPESVTRLGS